MKIGFMNHPRKNLLDEIDYIKANDFDFIDLTWESPMLENFDLTKTKKRLQEYNIEVVGHTDPHLPAIYPNPQIRQACLKNLKQAADVFFELGAKKMNIHPFSYAGMQSVKEVLEANDELIGEVLNYTKNLGLELMLENYITPFDTPKYFQMIRKDFPDLKIHIDIGHCNIMANATQIVTDFFEIFGKDIIHLHLHDNKGKLDEHLPIGCGNIDWPKIVRILKKFNFDETITLEVFSPDVDYLLLSKKKLEKLWQET